MGKYRKLRCTIRESGVAEVVLTDGAHGNPIDHAFCDDMNALSIALSVDPKVRVVLLRAEPGAKAFGVGGDLSIFGADLDALPRVVLELTAGLHVAIARLQRMNAPLVTAVHAVCAGGMTSFVAGSDIVVAAEEARFVAAYAGIGFSCDAGSSVMLTRRMGLGRARKFLLMNESLDAKAAQAAGLVDEVVPGATLLERAEAIADQLSKGPTRALGETRRLLLSAVYEPLETQLELEAQALARVTQTEDAREGVTAFAAKRKPRFTGR